MLKSLKDINAASREIKWLAGASVGFMLIITLYTTYSTKTLVNEHLSRIYILDQGSVVMAQARNIKENRPAEARSHVERFHQYFFTLAPDQKAILTTIDRALSLADTSARNKFELFKEQGYYNKIISDNVSQNILVERVEVDSTVYPMTVVCYAKQELIRPSTVTLRELITECTLRDVMRSDNNPHGFLIENWDVVSNKDIKTMRRQ